MENYESGQVREVMRKELDALMESGVGLLRKDGGKNPDLYKEDTHLYLMEHGWKLLFSLEEKQWPENFRKLKYDSVFVWPMYSAYCYLMDVICPPLIPHVLLHFGYAVLGDRLIKCAFFVVQRMVDYQIMPQGMVIDPLAIRSGKKPSFYVGCPVDKEDIENFLIKKKGPLELHVERKGREEHERQLYDSYMEAYVLQVAMAPGWFPPELIKSAEKEGLAIPRQEKQP